jgi:hypothetical protein
MDYRCTVSVSVELELTLVDGVTVAEVLIQGRLAGRVFPDPAGEDLWIVQGQEGLAYGFPDFEDAKKAVLHDYLELGGRPESFSPLSPAASTWQEQAYSALHAESFGEAVRLSRAHLAPDECNERVVALMQRLDARKQEIVAQKQRSRDERTGTSRARRKLAGVPVAPAEANPKLPAG